MNRPRPSERDLWAIVVLLSGAVSGFLTGLLVNALGLAG